MAHQPAHSHYLAAAMTVRRLIAEASLLVVVPITLIAALLAAPFGLALPFLVWLARHSFHYERELADLYGPDSPELKDSAVGHG